MDEPRRGFCLQPNHPPIIHQGRTFKASHRLHSFRIWKFSPLAYLKAIPPQFIILSGTQKLAQNKVKKKKESDDNGEENSFAGVMAGLCTGWDLLVLERERHGQCQRESESGRRECRAQSPGDHSRHQRKYLLLDQLGFWQVLWVIYQTPSPSYLLLLHLSIIHGEIYLYI